jgi:AraC-like DNA-binding protein
MIMNKKIAVTTSLLLLTTQFCHAHVLTLDEADGIIVILISIVIALLVVGGFGWHYSRIISQRNEQLRRILNALDDYRAIVGDEKLTLDEQEEMLKKKQLEPKPKSKPKMTKAAQMDEGQAFFVKMDARVNKEKPFTDPNFDYYALIEFMGVSQDTFCKLVPRYTDPERTKDYINSLRAEYAAKILMEHSDYSMDDMVSMCGFKDIAAFNSAFKFSFGITPTDYLNSISQMFKKKV